MPAHPMRRVEAPTPHPARDRALVRGWFVDHGSAPRIVRLTLLAATAAVFAGPAREPLARFLGAGTHLAILAGVVSALTVPFCKLLAVRLAAVDWPDRRKARGRPTPRMGALAPAAGVGIAMAVADLRSPLAVPLGGAALVLATGLLRDVLPLPRWIGSIATGTAATLIVLGGGRLAAVPPVGPLGSALDGGLALLWLLAIAHGLERLDRVDGAAAGTTAVAAAALLWAGSGTMAAVLLGAALGFLPCNLRPGRAATLFLGRGGAPALGMLLGALALGVGAPAAPPPLAAALFLALPLYEATRTLAIRAAEGRAPEGDDGVAGALASLARSRALGVALLLVLGAALAAGGASVTLGGATVPGALQAALLLFLLALLDVAGSRRERRSR